MEKYIRAYELAMAKARLKSGTEEKAIPREGYKCITIRTEVYDYYYANWLAHKKEYALKGISSFSGYITYILNNAIDEKNDC